MAANQGAIFSVHLEIYKKKILKLIMLNCNGFLSPA